MNSRPIILLGGTGDIGQRLARRLRQAHDAPILLCSRNPLGASGWARQLSAKLVSIDTTAAKNVEQLPSPSLVINLTETTSPEFVAACLERGMVFFDTSASEAYFKAMVAAGNATNQGTIVPQVGLMPGLTNLLAVALCSENPNIRAIRVFLELGLGRHYGPAATNWILRSIANGASSRNVRVNFPGRAGDAIAISYPFSDSPAIQDEIRLDWAESYLSLTPSTITRILSLAVRLGLTASIAHNAQALTRLLHRLPPLGKVTTRVLVIGYEEDSTEVARIGLSAFDQADLTAFIVAHVANRLPESLPVGVVPITQLTTASRLLPSILIAFPGSVSENRKVTV